MKTKIFLSLLAVAVLSTATLSATNPNKKIYQNIESTEFGTTKELISFKEDSGEPAAKAIYYYGTEGKLQKKVMYIWSDANGWESYNKYDYEYNNNGRISNMIYTAWDKKLDVWSPKSLKLIYVYDNNGKFYAMKKIEDQ